MNTGFRSIYKELELLQKEWLHLRKYPKVKLKVTYIVLYPYGPSMAKYWKPYVLAIPGRNTSVV